MCALLKFAANLSWEESSVQQKEWGFRHFDLRRNIKEWNLMQSVKWGT